MNTINFSGLPSAGPRSADKKSLKLAVLGDASTQLLSQAINRAGKKSDYSLEMFEGDYDQVAQLVNDGQSELYKFSPQVLLICLSSEALLKAYYGTAMPDRANFAEATLLEIVHLLDTVSARIEHLKIIFANFVEINDGVSGNNANRSTTSFLYAIRRLNLRLMELAAARAELFVLDMALLQNELGRSVFSDSRLYVNASMVHAPDALPLIAHNFMGLINASQSNVRKCLILDLDNTVWGGVIGDDGVENIEIGDLGVGKAFSRLQYWAKELKQRGILLAVCSKNTESVAKEPFEKHPDMILKLEDISVFVANWDDKAGNIRYIQSVLNIGFDSMVFVDDNKFERELVKAAIPELTVPDLPEDPAEYFDYLTRLNLFEAGTQSTLDADRTRMIQLELSRNEMKMNFANEDEFLQDIRMVCTIAGFSSFNTPRVAQLSERSNQFNLRTLRYTVQDVQAIAADPGRVGMAFSLADRLGDHGLISVVVLQQQGDKLFIENWFMSCRVLKRGMEQAVLNELVGIARQRGCDMIVGEYISTKKNALVAKHYEDLGFQSAGDGIWNLPLADFNERKHFIGVERL